MRRAGALRFRLLLLGLTACSVTDKAGQPIFVDGRAVITLGDSLLALTHSKVDGFLVRDRRTGKLDTLGRGHLTSPLQLQFMNGSWHVSDVRGSDYFVVSLDAEGNLLKRVDVSRWASAPHQFAMLPDGRLVLEGRDGRLLSVKDDSITTFAASEEADKSGLLVPARGGVIHAVPDYFITQYNGFGNILWRLEWPWLETAVATDVAVDQEGRVHLLAAVPSEEHFRVYTLSKLTGEVTRWSPPAASPTFVVERLGQLTVADAERWLNQ